MAQTTDELSPPAGRNGSAGGDGYVDPELKPVLSALPPNPLGVGDYGIAQARADSDLLPIIEPPADLGIGHTDLPAEPATGRPAVRIIAPEEPRAGRPCLLWIHGGGYVGGSPFITDLRLFRWAGEHDCVVVAVQYGLAPEKPYPAGLEDCYAGLSWVHEHADELGVDPARVAVVGESAGGGLAAALAILARDRGEYPILFQLLIYPMVDDRTVLDADRPDAPVWTKAANALAWAAYHSGLAHGQTPPITAAPGRARPDQLTGLPPCFLSVGSLDLFRDEVIDYAKALQRAGVPAELHVYAGTFHASDHLAPEAAVSRRFERDLDTALGRALLGRRPVA